MQLQIWVSSFSHDNSGNDLMATLWMFTEFSGFDVLYRMFVLLYTHHYTCIHTKVIVVQQLNDNNELRWGSHTHTYVHTMPQQSWELSHIENTKQGKNVNNNNYNIKNIS